MHPDALQVEIRPRSAGQLFALAMRLLQARTRPLLTAWASYTVATLAAALGMLIGLEWPPALVWFLTLSLSSLFAGPVVATVGLLVFSPTIRARDVVRMALKRFLPYAVSLIGMRLATLIAGCALVIPGYYVWRQAWFLGPVVHLEGAPLRASMTRAARFAVGFNGHVLGHAFYCALMLIYLSSAFASLVVLLLRGVIGANVPGLDAVMAYEHMPHVIALVGYAVAAPFVTMVWFFVYLDVRTRKEGWDLEIAFRARADQLERGRG